jgi:beta-glucosidase
MEMWLPGDAQGPAAARLLYGDAEPSGRLPVTFPGDESQGPAQQSAQYPGDLSSKGAVDHAHFDEGVMVGYRYWDQFQQQPLFPFGFGLSYTQFKRQAYSVRKTSDGGAEVHFTLSNVGQRDGADVVEVYLGFPRAAGEPPRQLKGFAKLAVKAGQSVPVTVKLDADAFKAWDEKAKAWTVYRGGYDVFVGTSSRDIDYTGHLAF